MTLNIPDRIRQDMELIEERIRDLIRPSVPKIDSLWNSSTKPGVRYSSTMRVKISIGGEKVVTFVHSDGKPTDPPTQWHNRAVIPILAIRGTYVQKMGAGLMLDVVAVMLGGVEERKEEEVYFI